MRVRLLTCLTAVAVVAGLAGCGGSSSGGGIASEPPQKILNDSLTAANGLKSVHAAGTINSGGQHITIDIQLVGGVGGQGQITLGGLSFKLVGLRNYAYMQAPPAVWQKAGAPASAAQALQGKWLRTPATGQFASIAKLTDIHQLFAQLLNEHGKKLATGAVSTVAGRKVVAVTGGQGTLYVAATGTPYPVEIVKPGTDGGRIDFDRFNEAVALSAPTNTIDLPQVSG
ncbi:MAG: hypothetical protein JO027_01535 [Solirubrobacterales bacterium]|nr:hypothetical protein [Solirubrobacterales bacterium]